ncbi:MAG: hypothetical protein Q8P81_00835 [Nanoarchaeota archaeon]|nr:hypothetical protein [Nanoarchaeota archaeon]
MRLFLTASKHAYDLLPPIISGLEDFGHVVTLPNCFDDVGMEERMARMGEVEHREFKERMFLQAIRKIRDVEGIVTANIIRRRGIDNYIGGSTFLELYEGWNHKKGLYLHNPIPEGMLYDEICGFGPVILNGDLSLIPHSREYELSSPAARE